MLFRSITTDGGGNLTFTDPNSLGMTDIPYIHFDVISNGNNQQFTTANISTFSSNNYINLFRELSGHDDWFVLKEIFDNKCKQISR